ncbi:hypothetical protein MAGR_08990 [Mycolicibacterium agri]|uniref:Helix-turn-helix domain-containing protein n=1 Tax=Mycolicibacterium agri TaxID=36811 RepID=A0A7I9VWG5_MYCAG|nr:hypothetical protein MAGR_08990 [Mycolicibacterium agri]
MGYKKPTTVKLLGERIKREHHTRLPNGLVRDPDVSANGFRVAAYLLSLDDGFGVNQRGIAAATGLTRDAVSSGIKNLAATGWLRQNEYRHEDSGHVYRHEYVMHRSRRMAGNPDHMTDVTETPNDAHMAGNPDHSMAGNPDHLKRNKRDTDTEVMSGISNSVGGSESGAQAPSGTRQPLTHGAPVAINAGDATPTLEPGTPTGEPAPRLCTTTTVYSRDPHQCWDCNLFPVEEDHAPTCPVLKDPWATPCAYCNAKFSSDQVNAHARACRSGD